MGVNGSALRNEVKEVGDPIFATEASKGYEWDNHSIIKNGYAIGSFYGYRVKGIFQNQPKLMPLTMRLPLVNTNPVLHNPGDLLLLG